MNYLYYGCHRESGHYFWVPGMTWYRGPLQPPLKPGYGRVMPACLPWDSVDMVLQPGCAVDHYGREIKTRPEVNGECLLHHKGGWTALCSWDRSVDDRGGCNSNFFAFGTHSFDEMLVIAKEQFPEVMNRFKFKLVLVETVESQSE